MQLHHECSVDGCLDSDVDFCDCHPLKSCSLKAFRLKPEVELLTALQATECQKRSCIRCSRFLDYPLGLTHRLKFPRAENLALTPLSMCALSSFNDRASAT